MNASQIANALLTSNLNRDDFAQIARAFKLAQNRMLSVAAVAFRKGDKVEFTNSRNGLTIRGSVVKVNAKTIDVLSDDRAKTWNLPGKGDWRVGASALRKVGA